MPSVLFYGAGASAKNAADDEQEEGEVNFRSLQCKCCIFVRFILASGTRWVDPQIREPPPATDAQDEKMDPRPASRQTASVVAAVDAPAVDVPASVARQCT